MELMEKVNVVERKFGKFELHRPLEQYEIDNREEFMKIATNDIDPREVSLTDSVNSFLKKMNKSILRK